MADPSLTKRVRTHYEARAFSPALIERLCAEIDRRTGDSGVEIASGWWVSAERLLEAFEPIEQSTRPAVLHPPPSAILTLSFGYRLNSLFARHPEDRQPGPNNTALAAMTERCHRLFPDAFVAAQYEVGLALGDRSAIDPQLLTPAQDWNTPQVLAFFVERLPARTLTENRNVIVVSHLHHYGRAALLLRQSGLETFPPPKEVVAYADYDAHEAQPRFRSPWEYLVNDFLAICKSASEGRTFADTKLVHAHFP
jgi:hypothetical protein